MEAPARFDRYEVLAPLGVGGMGEVVKARAVGPHGFEKLVAIKRIRAEWAQQDAMAARFIREAQIAARLQHANIVQVFDFGRHGDELFLVMELVDGQSLDDILASLREKGKRPTLAQTLQIALDVTRALESAHGLEDGEAHGVVHRDVSPANVMISRQGIVKLTDFGIAAWAKNQGRTSLVAGKPMYMAPEQLRGDPLDGRADLFAVGLLLYEMITGQRPWKGMVDPSPEASLETMDYTPPSRYAPDVPPEVDALVGALLCLDPEGRPETAKEVARALVEASYKCQIVLDPSELRPLIGASTTDAHAPTQPSNPSKVETLVATGVSEDGSTMLARSETPRLGEPAPARRATPAWLLVALGLFAIGGVGFAWAALSPSTALHAEPAVAPVTPEVVAPETASPNPLAEPAETTPAPPIEPSLPSEPAGPSARAEPDLERGDEGEAPEPDPSGAEEPTPTSAARSPRAGASARRRRARAGAAAGEAGVIDISARPWAEIYIDGARYAHNAPRPNIPIAAGRHEIRLVNPVLGTERRRTVTIAPGQHARLVGISMLPD